MARSESNILAKDTGRVQTAALGVLCALAGLQMVLLGWSAWLAVSGQGTAEELSFPTGTLTRKSVSEAVMTMPPLPGPPAPGQLAGVQGFSSGSTPGLMPPLPGTLAGEVLAEAPTASLGAGAPPLGLTLPVPDPEVAELLETVSQLRSGGETEGLLELLKAAEGMDQSHPAVMKEFALTYEQMGLTDKAREYWRRIVAGGEVSGGVFFSLAQQRLERLGGDLSVPSAPPVPGAVLTSPNMVGGIPVPVPVPAPAPAPALPKATVKVAQEPGAKLGVGGCQVVKDLAVATGDRRTLRIPILKLGDDLIEPSAVNVDVFFYDLVNGTKVEPTRADPPVASWVASPVDWSGAGMEPLDVTYFLPPMSAQEERNHGRREFHGYLVKLYYKDRLQAVVAEPRELLEESSAPSLTSPANPLPGR